MSLKWFKKILYNSLLEIFSRYLYAQGWFNKVCIPSKSNWSIFGVGWGHLKCGEAKYQRCREVALHCVRHGLWLQPMQFSFRKELAIQLQGVLLPERFYLKSAEDASRVWSQANDQGHVHSCPTWVWPKGTFLPWSSQWYLEIILPS